MNDRFKFRCFSRKTKKMYEVDSLHLDSKDGEWVWVHYYNPIYDKDLKIQIVQPDAVVMQCTGLKDKNGKLIYEGDIISENWHKYILEWGRGDFQLRDFAKGSVYTFPAGICIEKCEIIGNIYINPELLEDNNG